jgi:hypothetical protein
MTMSVVTSVSTVGSKKVPPCMARLPPVTTLGLFFRVSAVCASTFSTAFMSISGLITVRGSYLRRLPNREGSTSSSLVLDEGAALGKSRWGETSAKRRWIVFRSALSSGYSG